MSQKNKGKPRRWKDTHRTRLKIRVLGNEVFIVSITPGMRVNELRRLLELSTGIPYDLQRLTYLDEAELVDTTTIKENEIVPGATVDLTVWNMWSDLVEKAIAGETSEIMKLGVDPSIHFTSPLVAYMDEKSMLAWIRKRAFVVLCIAAHRQHLDLCEQILPFVQSLNSRTPTGRTALHIASSMGRSEVVKLLIEKGAKMNLIDCDGLMALDLAGLFGQCETERLIQMCAYKEKMQKRPFVKKKLESPKSLKKEETIPEDIVPEIKPKIQEVLPSEAFVEQEKIKCVAVDKDEPEEDKIRMFGEKRMTQLADDSKPPSGYSKDSNTFRRYLESIRKQSKNFGYAASIIDDHIQRLDNVRYDTFHCRVLPSEKETCD